MAHWEFWSRIVQTVVGAILIFIGAAVWRFVNKRYKTAERVEQLATATFSAAERNSAKVMCVVYDGVSAFGLVYSGYLLTKVSNSPMRIVEWVMILFFFVARLGLFLSLYWHMKRVRLIRAFEAIDKAAPTNQVLTGITFIPQTVMSQAPLDKLSGYALLSALVYLWFAVSFAVVKWSPSMNAPPQTQPSTVLSRP
jgi:hypothetical protein